MITNQENQKNTSREQLKYEDALNTLKEAYVQKHLTNIKQPDIFDVRTAENQFKKLIKIIKAKSWDECQNAIATYYYNKTGTYEIAAHNPHKK